MSRFSFSTSSDVRSMMSRTVSVLSWEADTESARSNDGSAASSPEINSRSTESSEETCSAVQMKPQNTLVAIDAITSLGRAFDRPVSLHQSAASRMLSKTSSGSPPPFLFHDAGFIVGSNVINHDVSPMIPQRVAHGGSHSHR